MSNNQAPYGFVPVRNRITAGPNYSTSQYQILGGGSPNTNSFGKGDVVILNSSGYIDKALTSSHSVLLGILDRIEYYDSTLNKKIFTNAWTGVTTALAGTVLAYVYDDPNLVFGVQSGNGGPFALSAVGQNFSMGGNGAPNTYGISVAYADYATIQTTNTLLFRTIAVPQNIAGVPTQNAPIGNDSTAVYNYVECMMNTSIAYNSTGI